MWKFLCVDQKTNRLELKLVVNNVIMHKREFLLVKHINKDEGRRALLTNSQPFDYAICLNKCYIMWWDLQKKNTKLLPNILTISRLQGQCLANDRFVHLCEDALKQKEPGFFPPDLCATVTHL